MNIDDLHSQDILNRVRKGILVGGNLIPSCCIASAAIWIGVLENFGLKGVPVSVRLDIFNPVFTKFIEARGRVPDSTTEIEAMDKAGGRMVCLGAPHKADDPYGLMDPKTNAWSGHLVVVARPKGGFGTGYIVDFSLPQAHRPEKGIALTEPLVIPADTHLLRQFVDGGRVRGKIGECLLSYESVSGDATYHASPDWHDQKGRWSILIEELTSAIRSYSKGARTVDDFRTQTLAEG